VSRGDATDRAGDAPLPAAAATPPSGDPIGPDATTLHRRVLVVEDSATIVSVVKYFLELDGFEVLVAENGLLGLEVALRERPDVIISDINMPGMGGVAMVKALRGDARTSKTRIIMLTSESSVESEAEGLDAGADDYMLKPVEPRRLAARVKALCARSRPTAA
jgi:DNA-binding response OmpR family regulator